MSIDRRSFLIGSASATALAALSLGPGAGLCRAQALPFTVIDRDWTDTLRTRAVPIRLYLPAWATPERPSPLVVFSHGMGGSRRGYSYLGSHWAAEGFASLHLQHVGSDNSVWTAGNPLALVRRLQEAAQESEAIARVHDLRFALDRLQAEELGQRLDLQRVVAAGHSYGANTALLAAGARVDRPGAAGDLRDARIHAAIIISAPPFHGEPSPQRILAPISVPNLHITATEDIIRIPGYYSDLADRVAMFDAVGSARKTLVVFTGGSHSMFTDRVAAGGVQLNALVKTATQELTTAFLRSVKQGDDSGLREWPRRHAPLLTRFVGPALG